MLSDQQPSARPSFLRGSLVAALDDAARGPTCVDFLPHLPRLVAGGADGTLQLWDVLTGARAPRGAGGPTGPARAHPVAAGTGPESCRIHRVRVAPDQVSLRHSLTRAEAGCYEGSGGGRGPSRLCAPSCHNAAFSLRFPSHYLSLSSLRPSPDFRSRAPLYYVYRQQTLFAYRLLPRIVLFSLSFDASGSGLAFPIGASNLRKCNSGICNSTRHSTLPGASRAHPILALPRHTPHPAPAPSRGTALPVAPTFERRLRRLDQASRPVFTGNAGPQSFVLTAGEDCTLRLFDPAVGGPSSSPSPSSPPSPLPIYLSIRSWCP